MYNMPERVNAKNAFNMLSKVCVQHSKSHRASTREFHLAQNRLILRPIQVV